MLPRDISELEAKIGYSFRNKELLRMAMTHSSFVNEHAGDRTTCNERLEFLGDSVLSLTVSNYLYNTYPKLPEGRLTVLRKHFVNKDVLPSFGMKIGLGNYLLLGKGESKDGREKPKLLEDAFEALVGALYLDSGSLDTVARFLLPFVQSELLNLQAVPLEDPKTLLQQYVQQTPGEELRYETVRECGPDNAKTFTVRVLINSNCFGEGSGCSKKEAEQNAAREALKTYLPKEV
ncbi:MAG: ribonuclease III [Ruminococcaceae bacterium]|nr:ribonuclease III [Oscillospiraceae bacterium]